MSATPSVTPDRELRPRSPRSHLRGTLALVAQLAARGGPSPGLGPLLRFLDRPGALPAAVDPARSGLKYDAYLTRGPAGAAWGVAVSDRHEGPGMAPAVAALLAELSASGALPAAEALRARLDGAGAELTVALGFDAPDAIPRVKLYLQERRWGEGLARAGALGALLATLPGGCALPAWVPEDQPVGVLTVERLASGVQRFKAYIGGPDPRALLPGAPPALRGLADRMAAACPAPGWSYATLRLRPGEAPGLAINKIYDVNALAFTDAPGALEAAWAEVGALFAAAGRSAAWTELQELRRALPDTLLVPTASALEAGGESVDLYCGAWAPEGSPPGTPTALS